MSIEAVVFDIGNVLIEWQPERYFDRRFGRAARERMFAATDLLAVHDLTDRGADFRMLIYETAAKHPEFSEMIRLWHDDWLEIAGPEISGSVKLLRALRARHTPVYALSNFGVGNFTLTESHYSFLSEFDRRYISGQMRTAKPDALIYEMVEADCGVTPGRLLFTDDRPENIDAAAERGWQTHLFQGPRGLARRLIAEGLLDEQEAGQE